MAINTQKFLPGSKGTAKPLPQAKISSITLTSQDKKNVNTIRVKTIQIDKMLKGTLAADKKRLDDKKKEASQKRKDDIETKLEKKPDPKKKFKMPNILPRMGVLDWIKNFIGNIILGYFAYRLVGNLPALKGLFTGIVAAGEFIIDWGGKILNGLVTFVDWGYKLYDGLRQFTGNIFGKSGLKVFDDFMSTLNLVLNAVIVIALAFGRIKLNPLKWFKGKKPKPSKPKVPKPKVGGRFKPKFRGGPGRGFPILSAIMAIFDFGSRKAAGESNERAAIGTGGGVLGGIAGAALAAILFPEPFTSAAGVITLGILGTLGYNFGAMGGDAVSDTVGFAKGGRVKKATRVVKPRGVVASKKKRPIKNIDPVKITPGEDIGDKTEGGGFFGWIKGMLGGFSPLKYFKEYGDKFGAIPFFGPIIALAVQALMGQKPGDEEYKNAGLGIISLLAKGLNIGKLVGSIGGVGFATGGLVDKSVLMKESKAADWLGKELKKSMTPIVDATISDLERNLGKRKQTNNKGTYPNPDSATGASMLTPGSVPGGKLNLNQLVHLAKAAGANDSEAIRLASIAMYESGGNSNAHNPKYPDNSYGLWQVNMLDEPGYMLGEERRNRYNLTNNEQLWDPATNAKIALDILRTSGWSAWSTDKLVTQKDLDAAKTALNASPPQSYSFKKKDGQSSQSYNIGGRGIVDIGKSLAKEGFAVAEHPDFTKFQGYTPGKGSVSNVHSGKGHYEGRALDVTDHRGSMADSKERYRSVLDNLYANRKNNNLKMLIHDSWGDWYSPNTSKSGPGSYGHPTHMHIETYHKGGKVPGRGERWAKLLGGEMVIDIDSAGPAKDLLLAINQASGRDGVMKAIRDYAPYEAIQSRMIPVPVDRMVPVPIPSKSGGGTVVIGGGGGNDPFSSLGLNA